MSFIRADSTYTFTAGGKTYTVNKRIIPGAARRKAYLEGVGYAVKPNVTIDGGKPKGITIHNTENIKVASGTNAAEQYSRAMWPNCNLGTVCVHFFVSGSVIWQNLEDTERGWHAADGNSRRKGHRGTQIGGNLDTIAIECIGTSAESETTAANLTSYLCDKYDLAPKLDVYTHNYFMHGVDKMVVGAGKNCPLYILPHWEKFLEQVESAASKTPPQTPQGNNITAPDGKLFSVQVGAFKHRKGAEKYAAELAEKGIQTMIILREVK